MIMLLFFFIAEAVCFQRYKDVVSVELTELLCDSHLAFISKFPETGIQSVLPIFGLVFLFALLDQFLLSP
jgi:hypothetical protein